MHILYLLFNTLLDYKAPSSRLVENKNEVLHNISLYTVDDISIPSIHNLNREVLYEGFISIESIIFLSQMKLIDDSFISKTVLPAKKLLLVDTNIRKFFLNFSPTVHNKELKKLLEARNKAFASDSSQIALSLTRDRILNLESRIQTKLVLIKDDKDKEYINMIQSLNKSLDGEDGLAVNLAKEKFEFYREKISLSKEQILEAKMALNLGGGIFSPSLLIEMVKRLTVYKKRDLVKKSIVSFISPLDILHSNIINKSFMDKKKQIIEFLISCLEIRNNPYREKLDAGFYNRSHLIEHFDPDLFQTLDKYQEEDIKKLIYIFENINEEEMGHVLIHDRRLVEIYLNYLCDGQDTSKMKLFGLFT